MKKVLVFTAKTDLHCDFVILELRKLGADAIRINTEDIPKNLSYHISQSNSTSHLEFLLHDSKIKFNSNDFYSVWYRKPDEAYLKDIDPIALDYIQQEQMNLLRSVYGLYSKKKWVNPYWANKKAAQKLLNHKVATDIGFNIPDTLVTNKYDDIVEFCDSYEWNVIIKPFNYSGFSMKDGTSWNCYAKKIDSELLERYKDNTMLAPTFLQKYIEKKVELRVTVIGNECYTASIESQSNDLAKVDFRATDVYDLKHTEYSLPSSIKTKLITFNNYFNLSFSTFDIIVNHDDEYVFLECNPNGQWYWIEDIAGIPLSKYMAKHLIE